MVLYLRIKCFSSSDRCCWIGGTFPCRAYTTNASWKVRKPPRESKIQRLNTCPPVPRVHARAAMHWLEWLLSTVLCHPMGPVLLIKYPDEVRWTLFMKRTRIWPKNGDRRRNMPKGGVFFAFFLGCNAPHIHGQIYGLFDGGYGVREGDILILTNLNLRSLHKVFRWMACSYYQEFEVKRWCRSRKGNVNSPSSGVWYQNQPQETLVKIALLTGNPPYFQW